MCQMRQKNHSFSRNIGAKIIKTIVDLRAKKEQYFEGFLKVKCVFKRLFCAAVEFLKQKMDQK